MMLKKGMKVAKVTVFLSDSENKPVITINTGFVVDEAREITSVVDDWRFPTGGAHKFLTDDIVNGGVYTVVPDTPEDIAKITDAARRWLSERRKAILGELVKRHAQFEHEAEPAISICDAG